MSVESLYFVVTGEVTGKTQDLIQSGTSSFQVPQRDGSPVSYIENDSDHLLRRSFSFRSGDSNVLGTGRLRLLIQGSGTNFHLRSHPQQPLKALESLSRRI